MRTEDITSVTRHRDHLRGHLNQIRRTRRPMFITNKSGQAEAVVMAPETYDRLMEQAERAQTLSLLDRSMEQVKAGGGKELRRAVADLAAGLGLELRR